MQPITNNVFPIANHNTHYSAFVNDSSFTFASQSFPNPPNPLLPLPPPTKQTNLFDLTWLNAPVAQTPNCPIYPPEHTIPFIPDDFLSMYGAPMNPHYSIQPVTPIMAQPDPPYSAESHSAPNQRKKNLREWERRKKLQNDEYILSFTAIQVTCAGCLRKIKLDSRDGARYYPGFWQRHKRRCQEVQDRIEAKKQMA